MTETTFVILWLGLGALGAGIGNAELRRRFPNQSHKNAWVAYIMSLLGPINLFCVFCVFWLMNPRDD